MDQVAFVSEEFLLLNLYFYLRLRLKPEAYSQPCQTWACCKNSKQGFEYASESIPIPTLTKYRTDKGSVKDMQILKIIKLGITS